MNKIVLSKLFINRLKTHAQLIDRIKRPLKSQEDLIFILANIRKLKFFREFLENTFRGSESQLLWDLCRSIKHEIFEKGDPIIKQNDQSNDKMYVILTGDAYVMRLEAGGDSFLEPRVSDPKTHESSQFSRDPLRKSPTRRNLREFTDFEGYLKRRYGRIIRELRNGDGFGEQALLWNVKRTASVVAKSNCDLLVIEKKDLIPIVDKYKHTYFRKEDLLDEVFPEIKQRISSQTAIQTIVYAFKILKLLKGNVLTQEGEENINGKVFLVEEGEFLVEKKCGEEEIKSVTGPEFVKIKGSITGFETNLKLCIVGRGGIVGEEILFRENGKYNYTVSCLSQEASVLQIAKNDVLSHCPLFFREGLLKVCEGKMESRRALIREHVMGIFSKVMAEVAAKNKLSAEQSFHQNAFNMRARKKKPNKNETENTKFFERRNSEKMDESGGSSFKVTKKNEDYLEESSQNLIIRKKQQTETVFNCKIRKITKNFLVNQTSSYLRHREITLAKSTKLQSSEDLHNPRSSLHFRDLFSGDMSPKARKLMNFKISSLSNKDWKPLPSMHFKGRNWLVDHFLEKSMKSVRKDWCTQSHETLKYGLSSHFSGFETPNEQSELYGINIRALKSKETPLMHCREYQPVGREVWGRRKSEKI